MPKVSRGGNRGRDGRRHGREVAAGLRAEAARTGAGRPDFTAQYRQWRRRRVFAGALIGFGLAVVATHVVVHLGDVRWLPTTGMQDLLTGYPMGGLLMIIGFALLPRL